METFTLLLLMAAILGSMLAYNRWKLNRQDRRFKAVAEAEKRRKTEQRVFTLEDLSKYDGRHPEVKNKIYVGVKGLVYDVSSRAFFYGPGSSYEAFTGADASLALAMSKVDRELTNKDWRHITANEQRTLDDWELTFSKYDVVGKIDLPWVNEIAQRDAKLAAMAAEKHD